jgi:putative DNA primase/helicase
LSTVSLLDAALAAAAEGWPVFPVNPANKVALIKGWQNAASTDSAQIQSWWTRWPKAMIGSLQGANGCFAVDFDVLDKTTGEVFDPADLLTALEDLTGELPATRVAATPSGGRHYYFRVPEGVVVARKIRKVAQTDICGARGYTILPPSARPDGQAYRWLSPGEVALAPAGLMALFTPDDHPDEPPAPVAPAPTALRQVGGGADAAIAKYVDSALAAEVRAVATAPSGQRNTRLNEAAVKLGGLVGAGVLSAADVRANLRRAAQESGLAKDDGLASVDKTIDSGLSFGMASPRDLSAIGRKAAGNTHVRNAAALRPNRPQASSGAADPAPPLEADGTPPSQGGGTPDSSDDGGAGEGPDVHFACAKLPLTDLGNAERFVKRFGDDFLHVDQWGWLAWDGQRWNGREADALLARKVHITIRAIAEEAEALAGTRDDYEVDVKRDGTIIMRSDKIRGWCLASQSNAHVSCVAKLAQSYLTARSDSFDADDMAFNVANGTLRFARTADGSPYVTLKPHDRADRMTKLTAVVYDPKAESPVYDAFLARVQPDSAMRRHLHAWGGLSLTALQVAKLSFWYGRGRNGKSTCIDAWAHVMGDYAQTIPIESFLDQGRSRKGGEASPDIAALPGVRGLRTSEPEKGSKLAESLVKLITGGEPLRARHLNKDFFEFRPKFKLTMQGNYKPRIDGTDEGIWARILMVPWSVMIPDGERDVDLPEKLRREASGILNRLLDGLCDYLDHGLSPTQEVLDATAEYREQSDPIGRFLTDCTVLSPGNREAKVEAKTIYALYVAWAKAEGESVFSPKGFSRSLQDHGVVRQKSSSIFYLGIDLTRQVEEFKGQEMSHEPDKKF